MTPEEARIEAGTDPVARWQLRLETVVGMGEAEREGLRARLAEYCAAHGLSPAELIVRRRPGRPGRRTSRWRAS